MENLGKYRDLILCLQEDPLASNSMIAEKTGLTLPTIRKYLEILQTGKPIPLVNGTYGEVDYGRIGLEYTYVQLDIESPMKNRDLIFNLADYHPYTNFQNTCYGSINGFSMRFSNPIGWSSTITKLFKSVQSELDINAIYSLTDQGDSFTSNLDYEKWRSNRWEFDVDQWIETAQTKNGRVHNGTDSKNLLDEISLLILITLRELSSGSRRKQSQIMKDILASQWYSDTEKQGFTDDKQRDFSRYYQYINENKLIKSYQLLFNHKVLKIYNQICITGKMSNKNQNLLRTAYNNSPLPFRSRLIFNGDNFVWLIFPPHEQITNFLKLSHELSNEMSVQIIDDDRKYQRIYPIWHRNFIQNLSGNGWLTTDEWMIDKPINEILG